MSPDTAKIHAINNDATQAYKGVIPLDRRQDPYMSMDHLRKEMEGGVVF